MIADEEIPADRWIRVSELAEAEGATRRDVYHAIDLGMPHSRVDRRIRVRRQDWHEFHESRIVVARKGSTP